MKISDAVFCVVDVESTGLDPRIDRLVEIACVATDSQSVLGMFSTLVGPGIPIPPEVSAVHGLTDADVAGAPTSEQAILWMHSFAKRFGKYEGLTPDDAGLVFAAHQYEFDSAFLRLSSGAGLCTKRLSMRLWPDYPAHKNQTLRFRRQLQVETYGIAAHRALGDALVTAALLRDELSCREFNDLEVDDVCALIELVEQPMRFKLWSFGKHRGELIEAAPRSYVDWALKLPDLSRDMRYTLEQLLRGAA